MSESNKNYVKLIFKNENNEILGYGICLNVDEDSRTQYHIEELLRNKKLGSNPNGISSFNCECARFPRVEGDELEFYIQGFLNGTYLPSDIRGKEDDLMISLGSHITSDSESSAGEFFFFRVPYGTSRIIDENEDGSVYINIILKESNSLGEEVETPTRSDSYVFISSTDQDLEFKDGLITTQSYLIVSDLKDLEGKYLAKFQDFIHNLNPLLNYESFIQALGVGKLYVKDPHAQVNLVRSFNRGDETKVGEVIYISVIDNNQDTDCENSENWIQL